MVQANREEEERKKNYEAAAKKVYVYSEAYIYILRQNNQ
jgi:hypothetical protein